MAKRAWKPEVIQRLMEDLIPFNRFLNMRMVSWEDNGVVLRIPFRSELVGDPFRPALHGGVISTLIDTAGGAMAFLSVESPHLVSTVDLVVDYLLPAPTADIDARARLIRRGSRVCVASVEVYPTAGGKVFATGRGVYSLVPTSDDQLMLRLQTASAGIS